MSDRILIDPQAFAEGGKQLQGRIALQDLHPRVHSPDMADIRAEVSYTLQGGIDRRQRLFLELYAEGVLPLYCQRCMKTMAFTLQERAHIVLFANEAALDEAMSADDMLEGMLLTAECDVLTLLEDQILMALPYSPKHDHCGGEDSTADSSRPNPFSVLAGLQPIR